MKSKAVFGGTGGLGQELRKVYAAEYFGSQDLNITKTADVRDFFENHQFDTVINLAGFNADGFIHCSDSVNVQKMLDVNIKGTLNLLRGCLPGMRERKHGRIILISSILAVDPQLGASVYGATKNFIDGITKACALENAREKVTCNAIRLGYFDAGMTHRIENWETIKYSIPMRRLGNIKELVNAIEFIEKTEYLTGACIDLAGGL